MVLPLLVAITLGLVWLLSVGLARLQAVDAARETARSLARGDPRPSAVALGQEIAPPGTVLSLSLDDERVTVTATATLHGPGGLVGFLPGVTVRARAVAAREQR